MCNFFSCVSDGNGKVMYFDAALRKRCLSGKLDYEPDSHTSIADFYGYVGSREDELNKYEYNPLTQELLIDQINTTNDAKLVEQFCNNLDFKNIVPELRIKPIVYPFRDRKAESVIDEDIALLRQWASVWDSVGASVWDSVRDSVWASVVAYVGTFFSLPQWVDGYPYQSVVDLRERGLVPSFDGKTWRLHGYEGKILWAMEVYP